MSLNSQWALVIATSALILITAWYARATWVMASRMKQQTDALIAPRVVVRAERRDGNVWLVVENKGLSSACDVRLSTDKAVPTNDRGWGQPLQDYRLFQDPPAHLAPDEKREMVIGSETWIRQHPNPYKPRFTITVTYTWPGGGQVTEDTPIEVNSLWSLAQQLRANQDRIDRGDD
jgi:hypothetical protein